MSQNNAPCGPGSLSILAVNNTDCACVSITQIKNNQPLQNSFTITLSNGQSITFPLIPGSSGTIAMRVDSGYIQYSSNGGAWVNLIALSTLVGPTGASGTAILTNLTTPVPTISTSWETVMTGTTDFTNPAKNLVNDGDSLKIRALITNNIAGVSTLSNTRMRLNNSVQVMGLNLGFYAPNITRIEYIITMVRTSSTGVILYTNYNFYTGTGTPFRLDGPWAYEPQVVVVPDFSANNQVITLEAHSLIIGDTSGELLIIEVEKKIQ